MAEDLEAEIVQVDGKTYEMVYERDVRGKSVMVIADKVTISWRIHPRPDLPSGFSRYAEITVSAHFAEDGMSLGVLGDPGTASRNLLVTLVPMKPDRDEARAVELDGREGWPVHLGQAMSPTPKQGQFFVAKADQSLIEEIVRAASTTGGLHNMLVSLVLERVFVEREVSPHGARAGALWLRGKCNGLVDYISFQTVCTTLNAAQPERHGDALLGRIHKRLNWVFIGMALGFLALLEHW